MGRDELDWRTRKLRNLVDTCLLTLVKNNLLNPYSTHFGAIVVLYVGSFCSINNSGELCAPQKIQRIRSGHSCQFSHASWSGD